MAQDERPAAGPRIAAAGAVGEEMNGGQGVEQATECESSISDCGFRIADCYRSIRNPQSEIRNSTHTPEPWLSSVRDRSAAASSTAARPRKHFQIFAKLRVEPRHFFQPPRQPHRERAALAQLAFQRDVAAQAAGTARGRSTAPGPCRSTRGSSRRRRAARPCAWRNFSNTSCWSSGLMPMPVSVTFSRRSPVSSRSAVTRIRPPSGVNLIAFDSRLLRICCTLAWSCRSGGRLGGDVAVEVDVLLLGQRPGHVALRRRRARRS